MKDEARSLLPAQVSRRALSRGGSLFRAGDRVGSVFIVESGRVRLVRHTTGGKEVTLAVTGPGEILAEASLFSDRYHCDAVADVPVRVAVYEKALVLQAIRTKPDFALAFAEALAREIQALRARIEIRNLRSARERVLAYLSLAPPPAGGEPPPLRELATQIGLTPEALYRTLARLEKEGLVKRSGRTLERT